MLPMTPMMMVSTLTLPFGVLLLMLTHSAALAPEAGAKAAGQSQNHLSC